MAVVDNETKLSLTSFRLLDPECRDVLVALASCRYDLPAPGPYDGQPLALAREQTPVSLEDVYTGDPTSSGLAVEGQAVHGRPGTDVYIVGCARAPDERPVESMVTKVRVGPCRKAVAVFGDRVWEARAGTLQASRPERFTTMPLGWERSFGGAGRATPGKPTPYEVRNPVGQGWYSSMSHADGQPLPNLEDPAALITAPRDRPSPAGYGAVHRAWEPRRSFAGTYDQKWAETRAPFWPRDLDPRFFCAASPGLNSGTPLVGGEPVTLHGFAPDGPYQLELPRRELELVAMIDGAPETQPLVLDTVIIDTEARALTLAWRVRVLMQGRDHLFAGAVVREAVASTVATPSVAAPPRRARP